MTADERLEALLNRAGQTISDLPRKGMEASEPYTLSACPKANGAAWNWYLDIGCDMDDYDSTRTKLVLKQYILHLTDIIDRMEWALDNALTEETVPLKPLARRLAGYAFPPGLKAREIVNNRGRDIHEIAVEGWEAFLRGMDWEANDADD